MKLMKAICTLWKYRGYDGGYIILDGIRYVKIIGCYRLSMKVKLLNGDVIKLPRFEVYDTREEAKLRLKQHH